MAIRSDDVFQILDNYFIQVDRKISKICFKMNINKIPGQNYFLYNIITKLQVIVTHERK